MPDDDRLPPGRDDLVVRVEALCRQSLEPVGVDGGGVALVTVRGHRATVCATDEVAALIEEAQFTLGEGPCVDASSARSPVLVGDLTDRSHGVQGRWPGFLEAAAGAGVRAVFAFPLRIGAIALGAMDLYRGSPGPLASGQLRAALLTADATALLLLDLATEGGHPLGGQDRHTAFRFRVHNAAGMVKVQLGTSIENALAHLRAVAFSQDRSVDDVAEDVIEGRLRFPQEDA
jgi:hypothetical protein